MVDALRGVLESRFHYNVFKKNEKTNYDCTIESPFCSVLRCDFLKQKK